MVRSSVDGICPTSRIRTNIISIEDVVMGSVEMHVLSSELHAAVLGTTDSFLSRIDSDDSSIRPTRVAIFVELVVSSYHRIYLMVYLHLLYSIFNRTSLSCRKAAGLYFRLLRRSDHSDNPPNSKRTVQGYKGTSARSLFIDSK